MQCKRFLAASVIAAAAAVPLLGVLPASAQPTSALHGHHVLHLKPYALHASPQDMQSDNQNLNDQSQNVGPGLIVTPAFVRATGDGTVAFAVSGSGFVPFTLVTLAVPGIGIGTLVATDFRGNFTTVLTSIGVAAGTYPVVAQDTVIPGEVGTAFVTIF